MRAGQGSARDTLSALDQVAALGEVVDEAQPVDAVLDAVCDRDAGRVLVAVADALAAGRDPRTLGEALIAALRDAFLSLMGVADEHLAPGERERASRVGAALGAAGLTRALDVLGEALVELSRKPDPRIVVEVALVRITQPSADRTLDAILERLDRLERGAPAPAAPAGADRAAPPPSAENGAAAAREVLSSRSRGGAAAGGSGAGSRQTLGAVARQRKGGGSAPAPEAAGRQRPGVRARQERIRSQERRGRTGWRGGGCERRTGRRGNGREPRRRGPSLPARRRRRKAECRPLGRSTPPGAGRCWAGCR